MNFALRAVIPSSQPQGSYLHLRAALFHSTPVLERRRRNHWDQRSNHSSKRFRRIHGKQQLLRNVSAFAEHMFQNWHNDFDDDPFVNGGPSWFKKQFSKKSRRKGKGNQGQKDFSGDWEQQNFGKRGFQFCEDDFQSARVFRAAFGGDRFFYSFIDEENSHWFNSSRFSNNDGRSRNWRQRFRDEYGYSSESDDLESNLASDRLALGLSASGPLTLEDVKLAYRSCALKWHPDRHQGSEKAVAEEKFKLCSAAYQSLCDRLGVA